MSQVDLQILSITMRQKIDAEVAKYPEGKQRSAVLMALRIVQDEVGYLHKAAMDEVASYLSLAPVAVYEVASFYSMYKLKPTGTHHIKVCNSISCKLCGSDKITAHLQKKLGVNIGETTTDGKFTLDYAECLAACCNAPVVIVNDKTYHNDVTESALDQLIDELSEE